VKSINDCLLTSLDIDSFNDFDQLRFLVVKADINALLAFDLLGVFGGTLDDRKLVEFVVVECICALNLVAANGLQPGATPLIEVK